QPGLAVGGIERDHRLLRPVLAHEHARLQAAALPPVLVEQRLARRFALGLRQRIDPLHSREQRLDGTATGVVDLQAGTYHAVTFALAQRQRLVAVVGIEAQVPTAVGLAVLPALAAEDQ